MQSLRNGTELGAYTLIRLIARGGMGEVYEAHERQLQRRVAIKVIAPTDPDEYDREDLIRRFMIEARTLARINHPNVVTIYTIESKPPVPYIAMELVEGCSFRQLLEEFTFTLDGALPLFLQMLDGIRCLHENHIIHRDLKPHNLLLRPDGQVKILDFGIAKHIGVSEQTRAGVIIGTLPYMAPELKGGLPATARSDIWSLGAIFFECLTGKRLSDYVQDGEVSYRPEIAAKVSPEMRALISHMTSPRPTDRYTGADQVLADLKAIQVRRPQVPASVWAALAKRVEALARERREKQDALEAPREPKAMTVPTVLVRSGLSRESDATSDGATMLVQTLPDARGRLGWLRRLVRNRAAWIAMGATAVAIPVFLNFPNRDATIPPPPIAPGPVTKPSSNPIPMPAATPSLLKSRPKPAAKIVLKEPVHRQILWLEPARLPTLSWSAPLDPGQYAIELAFDPEFAKVVVREPVNGSDFRPERILSEGTYFWRLVPMDGKSRGVGPQSFTVTTLAPVELIGPSAAEVIDAGKKGSAAVRLLWKCKAGVAEYRVQMSADPRFAELIADRTIRACQSRELKLKPAQYHWRVQPVGGPRDDLWSETRTITIRGRTPPPAVLANNAVRPKAAPPPATPVEPKLKRPRVDLTLKFKSGGRDVATGTGAVEQYPTLEWTLQKSFARYQVQIARDADFDNLVSEEVVTGAATEWKSVSPGHFSWRVAAVGADEQPGPYSATGTLNIFLPPPTIDHINKLILSTGRMTDEKVRATWRPVPMAHQYVLEISSRPDMSGASRATSSTSEFTLEAKPGIQYLRVAAADESGTLLSDFSSVAPAEVESPRGPESPRPISPPIGARAPSKAGKISIVFSWSRVTTADSYELEIASDPGFTKILERRIAKHRGALLQQAELKGRIHWRVRAVAGKQRSPWSETGYFDIK